MLRIITKSNLLLVPNAIKQKFIRQLISNTNSTKQQQDIQSIHQVNKVQIIGTIQKHLFTLPSGYKSFIVMTKERNNRFYYHMVGTSTSATCAANQRVQISGRICSQNIWDGENSLRQKLVIKAGPFELLSNTNDHADMNHVQLCSQISSDIENNNDSSAFTLTTHHKPKGGVSAGISIAENLRIIIRNPNLMSLARDKLEKMDWVRIEGSVHYTYSVNSDKKQRSSGYILANNITKINDPAV